jgi:DNA modification methylase
MDGTLTLPTIEEQLQQEVPRKTRRRANELDGKTWTRYSISVWSDITKTPEERSFKHPAMFPVVLPKRLIEIFTTSADRYILDPFMGTGATLVAAKELGKVGVGFEVNPEYIDFAWARLQNNLFEENVENAPRIYYADARWMLKFIEPETIDLCITSPPYWDVLSQKRTADNRAIRDYSKITPLEIEGLPPFAISEEDLGRITDYNLFLDAVAGVFAEVYKVLRAEKYCVVNVMDLRKKDRFYPLHSDLAVRLQEVGFIYDDLIIWDRRAEYSNMRPLGYPSVFRVNKAHEYLLIFKKP